MPLSADEEKALNDLIAKRDAPEPAGPNGPNVEVYIDLASQEAVERAIAFGLLTPTEAKQLEKETPPADDDGKPPAEEKPKPKRGYFKDPDDAG